MRFILLTALSMLFAIVAEAQPWLQNLPDSKSRIELTFFDYQQAFETYWKPFMVENGYYVENGEKKKAAGWKQFRRWEYMMEHSVNMQTGAFPTKGALDVTREYYKNHPLPRTLREAHWTSVGPAYSDGGYEGIGRFNCMGFHPDNPSMYWAGAASGGLWVTQDDGTTWRCLTDQNESLGITDVIIPHDFELSQTIYISTGDRDSYDNNSIGVLKSTDAGLTWNATGLTYTLAQRKFINRLIQDPQDPHHLVAATVDGVMETKDDGEHWSTVLTTREFIDICFHPEDPTIIYGSNFNGEIFRSINGGLNWSRTFFENDASRIALAVSPDEPSWVYAVAVTGGLEGVYKSIDEGATFIKQLDGDTLNLMHWNISGIGTGGQGYYDLGLAVSPTNANLLLVGGINTWRSENGGISWEPSNGFSGGGITPVHADKHDIRFSPNGDIWECNDGGIYVSKDEGQDWINKTNGIAVSQIYRMAVSAAGQDDIAIGLQDNGSKLWSGGLWKHVTSGDGTDCMIDYTDVNVQYTSSQYGNLFRTRDHWGSTRFIKPQAAGEGAWVTPFAMNPENPNIIYGAYREIWKSIDQGDNWVQVSAINATDKIRSMAIAPSNPNIIYVAETGRIWKTITGELPFEKIGNQEPGSSNSIAYIAVKHDDSQTLWVAANNYWHPGVYQSTDGGDSWTITSEGLPPIPIYTIVENKQGTEGVELYVGTELGVYYKKGYASWLPFNTGLPNVIVTELEIQYNTDPTLTKLRAATYGRGVWETRLQFASFPMEFLAATTKQSNLDSINPGQLDQDILKIEIQTQGDLAPLHALAFNFTTKGSTNAMKDIQRAKLFYSGSVNTYPGAVQFGETVLQPNGTFMIEDDQPLNTGVNYFWLTYDIHANATIGDVVDAQCLSFTLENEIIPAITNPEGNREIQLIYCDAGSDHLSQDFISNVTSGNINLDSEKGAGGYQSFTEHVIDMEIGKSIPISVTNNAPHTGNALLIWVDWNRDGDFEDNGEEVYSSGPLGITTYNTMITPPANSFVGLTRMRIRLHDTTFGPNATPCGDAFLGEVEDYTVNVLEEVMTGIADVSTENSVLVYPNPVSGKLTIEVIGNQNFIPLEIFNLFGQRVYQDEIQNKLVIPTETWTPEMYFIHLLSHRGDRWVRFIKQ